MHTCIYIYMTSGAPVESSAAGERTPPYSPITCRRDCPLAASALRLEAECQCVCSPALPPKREATDASRAPKPAPSSTSRTAPVATTLAGVVLVWLTVALTAAPALGAAICRASNDSASERDAARRPPVTAAAAVPPTAATARTLRAVSETHRDASHPVTPTRAAGQVPQAPTPRR